MATLTSRDDDFEALERRCTAIGITNMRLKNENAALHVTLEHVANVIVDLATAEQALDNEDHEMQDLVTCLETIENHIHDVRVHKTAIMELVLTACAERLQGAISDLCFELAQVP